MAAFAACNHLSGVTRFLDADTDLSAMQVLDVRSAPEVKQLPFAAPGRVVHIPLDELRDRLSELDCMAETVVTCQTSLRAHVAARILKQSGFQRVHVISGGALVRSRLPITTK